MLSHADSMVKIRHLQDMVNSRLRDRERNESPQDVVAGGDRETQPAVVWPERL